MRRRFDSILKQRLAMTAERFGASWFETRGVAALLTMRV
jgi:hypothetical protein